MEKLSQLNKEIYIGESENDLEIDSSVTKKLYLKKRKDKFA